MKEPLILLLLTATALAVSVDITYPTNNHHNSNTYTVQWTGTGAACYRLFESIDDENNYVGIQLAQKTDTSKQFTNIDGKYYYQVIAYSNQGCSQSPTTSVSKYIIVDTVSPSVVSVTPSNNSVGVSSSSLVTVVFSEAMNQSSVVLDAVPAVGDGAAWLNASTFVFTPSPGLAEGTNYTVMIGAGAKDLAGNALVGGAFSFSFQTSVSTIQSVLITSPTPSASIYEEDTITITSVVKGTNNIPVSGAAVTASGLCSKTLAETSTPGTYSTTCSVPSGSAGRQNISITATKANTVTARMALTVLEKAHLSINITAPTSFTSRRGQAVPIRVSLSSDAGAIIYQEVSSPDLSFQRSGDAWTATLTTTWTSPADLTVTIDATADINATVGGALQHAGAQRLVYFTIIPVSLNASVEVLGNARKKEAINSGDLVSVRVRATYPDGSLVPNASVSGTLAIASSAGTEQSLSLSFSKSGDFFAANDVYTAKAIDSSFRATATITDAYGNEGEASALQKGPTVGLRVDVVEPSGQRVFAPGQTARASVKVFSGAENKYVTTATVKYDNKTSTRSGEAYTFSFVVPRAAHGSKQSLPLEIKYGGITDFASFDYDVSTQLSAALISKQIVKNHEFRVKISYPNGEPVTAGEFKLAARDNYFDLEPTGQEWVASVDLGNLDLSVQATIVGTDASGNAANAQLETVPYSPSTPTALFLGMQLWTILGALFGLATGVGMILYNRSRKKKDKKERTQEELNRIRREYVEKKCALELVPKKKKVAELLFFKRAMSEQGFKEYSNKCKQEEIDLEAAISSLEATYPFLVSEQLVQQKIRQLVEAEEASLKQTVTRDAKIMDGLREAQSLLERSRPEQVRGYVLKKYGEDAGTEILKRLNL